MDKRSLQKYLHLKTVFCSINSLTSLCQLLKIDKRRIGLLATQAMYKTFTIPKRNGGQRTIEAPPANLKNILSRLNQYLQAVYFFEKSNAAYGFILGVRNDEDRRNILSNARQHIGRPYLMNVDLQDFFHTVTREKVVDIFAGPPFNFRKPIYDLLADITTYKGRLPMGTPTSPALSNFACRQLDEELKTFADAMLWTYTRYADDMTFSSKGSFVAEKVNSIRGIIRKNDFKINQRKLKIYGPEDKKIVTGLIVADSVTLAPDFLQKLDADIQQLKAIILAQNEQGQLSTRWVEQVKQQVRGRLSFAGFVLKKRDEKYIQLKDDYYTAINPPEESFGAISWRGFPYNI